MKPDLKKFVVSPSVVPADRESELHITSTDGIFRFYDDVTYEVQFIPQDESDVPLDAEMSLLGYNKARKTFSVQPHNGVLTVSYFFRGEQEWGIRIWTNDEGYSKHANPLYSHYRPYWDGLLHAPRAGVVLNVYSLCPDLYSRRALRGDLHVHTTISDGSESPATVCAAYRKAGRDFVAITDHNVFYASKDAEKQLAFMRNFQILKGEEVHNDYAGFYHMVNIGGQYSINELYLQHPEQVKQEMEELSGEVEVPEGLDAQEYIGRLWLYRAIKKSGGYAIHPHPYWNIGYYHTSTAMSKAMMKNGLCDAFEVIGGCTPKQNNQQLALYQDLLAEGVSLPIVGSTDSHSVLDNSHVLRSTMVFAEGDDILSAIADKYSVAIESLPGEAVRVYGSLRLVMYTHFLLENYLPLHDELCEISGTLAMQYVSGATEVKTMIEQTEDRISALEKSFFGR